MVKLIGLTGSMGVGKSTAVSVLKEQFGTGNIVLVKFAGVLYELQETIYERLSPVYKRPPDFVKDRKLLQFLGTEFGRGLDENLWIKLWKAEAESYLSKDFIVVSDDVRFDNEAEIIKNMGGVVIKITSDKIDSRNVAKDGIKNHASEAGVDKKYIDYHIKNDNTLEMYRKELKNLFVTLTEVTE